MTEHFSRAVDIMVSNNQITDLDYADYVVLFVQQASQNAEASRTMEQEQQPAKMGLHDVSWAKTKVQNIG